MDRSILLDRDADAPLYRQIAADLVASIRSGARSPGERLPATRELAQELGVNRITVQLAYRHLQDEGWIRSHVGQGSFVAAQPPGTAAESAARDGVVRASAEPRAERSLCTAAVERLFERARSRAAWPEVGSDAIDFSGRVPDERLFDVDGFRHAVDRALALRGAELLQYGPPAGDEGLRSWIAERLRSRGIAAQAADVLLVNGAQQGLSLVAQSLASSGERVACERPTYHQALDIFGGLGLRVAGLPLGERGPSVAHLQELLRADRPRLLYTMPEFQNPTGTTQAPETRRALVEAAASAGVPLVEDDFEHELRFRGTTPLALAAHPGARHVIHLGTFSKGLFPGVRVGWIHAAPALLARIAQLKRTLDLGGGTLIQAALGEFVATGAYERHLEVLRRSLAQKHAAAQEALQRHFAGRARWTAPDGGYGVWVELEESVDAPRLQRHAAREGVVYTPGELFYDTPPERTCLRLSLSRVDVERIEPGLQRLARALDGARRAIGFRSPASAMPVL
ncbi:MAG: PLP-dependent aminotransferase family protein [Planctomycetes bacterium]|nr:PLP-dependent aminotransferase family protein [Planctomycetota bacterium]